MALERRSEDELRDALDELPEARPVLRLVAALNYKRGVAVSEIAATYGVSDRTVYNWLDRLETGELPEAVYDDRRPGRPPRLSESQRSALEAVLDESPAAAGYDAVEWTPELVAAYVEREFGVEFSLRHTRRLMADLA